ncbi:hypothetical protein Tco_1354542 [Tanacetum coccineum]
MNSSLVALILESRYLSTRVTDAKFGSADRGFVLSVVGGGVGVDCGGGGVKDGNDCRMTVVYIDATSDEMVRRLVLELISLLCNIRKMSLEHLL